jgi:hypothetical protein
MYPVNEIIIAPVTRRKVSVGQSGFQGHVLSNWKISRQAE